MSEQEREKIVREGDEPESDVEGHIKRRSEGAEPEGEAGMRREGDEPDVEGHMKR